MSYLITSVISAAVALVVSFTGAPVANDIEIKEINDKLEQVNSELEERIKNQEEFISNMEKDLMDEYKKQQKFVEENFSQNLGADAVKPLAGTTYTLSGSGISSSATSIGLNSFTLPQNGYKIQDSDLSDTFYITLEPGNRSRQEIASCTTVVQNADGTATFSGCTRGLSPLTPFTASSSLQFAHGGGSSLIFSDPPQLFNQAAFKSNDEHITGTYGFDISPIELESGNSTSSKQYATRGFAEGLSQQGCADISTSQLGCARQGLPGQLASSTLTASTTVGGINAITGDFLQAVTSATATIPVTGADGKLNLNFLATSTQSLKLGKPFTVNASSTLDTGTTTLQELRMTTGTTTINGSPYKWPVSTSTRPTDVPEVTSDHASSTVLSMGRDGNLSWSYPILTPVIGLEKQPINTLGDQTITHNLGRPPQLIEITSIAETDDTTNQFLSQSFGTWRASSTATIATSTSQHVIAGAVSDTATSISKRQESGFMICHMDATAECGANSEALAFIKNITKDTFVVDWTINQNQGTDRLFNWKVW